MATKIERDVKLLEMSANVKAFALRKKAALAEELIELKKVQSSIGGSLQDALSTKSKPGVVNEINEFLK